MLIRVLGSKEYLETLALQRELVGRRLRDEIPDTLLLVEHEPVYTTGASSKAPVPPGLPHPVHRVERGGDLTYHGPGQLVGYPILDIRALGLKPRSYLRTLEAVLAEALRPLGVEAETLRGFTGLWAGGRKIGSIGVAVRDRVSYHGFSINVGAESLLGFRAIHPCRLEPEQMSSLEKALGHPLAMDAVIESVSRAFLSYVARPPAELKAPKPKRRLPSP